MHSKLGSLDTRVRGAKLWDVVWFQTETGAIDYAPGHSLVPVEQPAGDEGYPSQVVGFRRAPGGPWLVISVELDLDRRYSRVTVRRLH